MMKETRVHTCGQRTIPGRMQLQRFRPRVWRIRERDLPDRQERPVGRGPRGKLKTTPEVKARLVSRSSSGAGYRPSLLQAVKETDSDTLPVEADAVLDWLVPPDPPGPLHGLAEILGGMSLGEQPDDDHEKINPLLHWDENEVYVGDPMHPRSGPVKDLYVNGHGFRVFTGKTEVHQVCRVCGSSIEREPVPAVCDFTCQGCDFPADKVQTIPGVSTPIPAEETIRVCRHGCQPDMNHDQCQCNGHVSARKRFKPRVTCSKACFKVHDSRRHQVFKPEGALVERVRTLRDLDDLTIARMCGESQKKIAKIRANLPE